MSDGAISQDEIDALLSGVAMDGLNSSGHVSNGPSFNIDISKLQGLADELKGNLEENINKFTGASFKAENPVVEIVDRDKILAKLPEVVIGVNADYTDGAKGTHFFLMSSELALKLFSLVNSEEATVVDDMVLSVVSEVVATYIGSQINSMDKTGKVPGLKYATPETINEPKAMVMFPQGKFAVFTYPLSLDSNAYTLWECMGGDVAEKFSKALGGGSDDVPELSGGMGTESMMGGAMNMGGAAMGTMGGMSMGGMSMGGGGMQPNMGGTMNMAGMAPNMGGMSMGGGGMQSNMGTAMNMGGMMPNMGGMAMGGMMPGMGMNMGMNVPNVQQLQFPNLVNNMPAGEQANINLIMDVNMEMTVELGRTEKSIKEILGMGEGTIIELDKLAGEPVDILVNHKKIAKGEVVVIDENFGVRVTEILSPMERVNELT